MNHSFAVIEDICREFGFSNLIQDISRIRSEVLEETLLNIAVLGRFKVGKSSFLNDIIGRSILPTGATPVTNVITRIQYGVSDSLTIHFSDGQLETFPLSQLYQFVKESENPKNKKKVDYVDITVPELEYISHLCFIDTPGTGSLFSHNTQVTREWIPGTGIALIAMDPGHPLGEEEIKIIETLQKYTPDIRILLTKTDLYPVENIKEIDRFIRDSIKELWGKSFPVYHYSTVHNNDAGKKEFISTALSPLEDHYSGRKKEIINHKLSSLVRECCDFLEITRISREKNEAERLHILQQVKDSEADHERITTELRMIAEHHVSTTRARITERLTPYVPGLSIKLLERFRKAYPDWKGNLFERSRRFEQWTAENISNELSVIMDDNLSYVNTLAESAKKHFEQYLETLREHLSHRVKETMNISLSPVKKNLGLRTIPMPDVSVSWAFDSNIDLLWFLFPMFLYKKMFGRVFENHLSGEVEKNIYRIIGQLTEKINETILEMKQDTLQRYTLEVTSICHTLSQPTEHGPSPVEALRKIEALP